MASLAINGAISASGQDLIINGSHYMPSFDLFAANIYTEDDVKLSELEIQDLEQYGFDYQKWSDVKRKWIVSNYTIVLGAIVLTGGSYIRYNTERPYLGLGLQIAGWSVIISSWLFQYKLDQDFSRWMDSLNTNVALGFTHNGFGLTYLF